MILLVLALVLVGTYVMLVLLAATGWLKKEPQKNTTTQNNWTVVVPFRNEENNLTRLLNSLATQKNPLKIILVNDHSTDDSLKIIGSFAEKHPLDIRVLTNLGEGKKMASVTGLKAVTTPYVFFTDADCEIPVDFFQTAAVLTHEADFFYGPVVYGVNGERTNAVFVLDQLALNAVALGLGKWGIHTYCSGANMGGNAVQLLPAIPVLEKSVNLSGDDVTYLQQAVKQQKKIKAITDQALTVYTLAPAGMGAFLQQRLRWGQKATGYRGFTLPALSALVWGVNSMVLFVLICCLSGVLCPLWYAVPLVKLCIDLLFLFLVALQMKLTPYLWAFLPAWLLNLMYIPVIGLWGGLTNTTWKGRKVKSQSGSTTL